MTARGLIPLVMFLALALLLAAGLTRDPSALPSEMIDRPFPDFELTTLDNPKEVLKELPAETVLINIFGSWCASCVIEHPALMAIAKSGEARIIGVNWRDSREKGRRWLDYYGDPYSLILFDEDSQLAIDLGVSGAPETFIVDKKGRIRYKHVGIITDAIWQDVLQPLIAKLEAET